MKLTAKLLKKLIQEEVQTEGHYHDMGGEDEMYNALDMPKRLSPKEIFGEFQNFVEVNNLSRADVEGMVEMLFSDVMDIPLNESPSMEHITPENIMMVINVLKDLGLSVAPAAGAALGISKMLDKTEDKRRTNKRRRCLTKGERLLKKSYKQQFKKIERNNLRLFPPKLLD